MQHGFALLSHTRTQEMWGPLKRGLVPSGQIAILHPPKSTMATKAKAPPAPEGELQDFSQGNKQTHPQRGESPRKRCRPIEKLSANSSQQIRLALGGLLLPKERAAPSGVAIPWIGQKKATGLFATKTAFQKKELQSEAFEEEGRSIEGSLKGCSPFGFIEITHILGQTNLGYGQKSPQHEP